MKAKGCGTRDGALRRHRVLRSAHHPIASQNRHPLGAGVLPQGFQWALAGEKTLREGAFARVEGGGQCQSVAEWVRTRSGSADALTRFGLTKTAGKAREGGAGEVNWYDAHLDDKVEGKVDEWSRDEDVEADLGEDHRESGALAEESGVEEVVLPLRRQ